MKASELFALVFVLAVGLSWVFNLVTLTNCDFKAPYKCEVVHAVGLVPAVSLVTVWIDGE